MLSFTSQIKLYLFSTCFSVQQQAQTLSNYSGILRLSNPFNINEETKNAEDYLSRLGFSQPHCQQNRRTTLPRGEQPYNITNSGYRGKLMFLLTLD